MVKKKSVKLSAIFFWLTMNAEKIEFMNERIIYFLAGSTVLLCFCAVFRMLDANASVLLKGKVCHFFNVVK